MKNNELSKFESDSFFDEFDDNKDEKKSNIDFEKFFTENKSVIYTALFYSFGLFLGAYFYKIAANDTLDALLIPENHGLLNMFVSNFCIYFSIYVIVVFLGFCLIGYPFINIIPLVIGISVGIRAAYLFINYSSKGVGYALIMLVPYTALFLTVISFAVNESAALSKKLIMLTKNKSSVSEFSLMPHIKKYIILAVGVALTAITDAGLTCLLFSVVTI